MDFLCIVVFIQPSLDCFLLYFKLWTFIFWAEEASKHNNGVQEGEPEGVRLCYMKVHL